MSVDMMYHVSDIYIHVSGDEGKINDIRYSECDEGYHNNEYHVNNIHE